MNYFAGTTQLEQLNDCRTTSIFQRWLILKENLNITNKKKKNPHILNVPQTKMLARRKKNSSSLIIWCLLGLTLRFSFNICLSLRKSIGLCGCRNMKQSDPICAKGSVCRLYSSICPNINN